MSRALVTLLISITAFHASQVSAQEDHTQSYFELGLTASMLVHPSIGYWWGDRGLRVGGMYLESRHYEFHLNIGHVIKDINNVQHTLNVLTSRIVGSDLGAHYDYSSTGIAYGLNYKGAFLEIGLAVPWQDEIGNLDDDPIIPCGYWGYIYRFK
jgi:hypothetical protein